MGREGKGREGKGREGKGENKIDYCSGSFELRVHEPKSNSFPLEHYSPIKYM
jgi:hypothetical protein